MDNKLIKMKDNIKSEIFMLLLEQHKYLAKASEIGVKIAEIIKEDGCNNNSNFVGPHPPHPPK